MKYALTLLVIASLMLSTMPAVFAVSVGTGVGVEIGTEDFAPLVWGCGDRVVYDDHTEPGRITLGEEELLERLNNYAFEGEQIEWTVLVMDKNGINKVEDVFATIGDVQGEGNDIEVNCVENPHWSDVVEESCGATILEEDLTGKDIDHAIQRYYTCTLTVETADSMYGEYFVTVEALDLDGLSGIMAENEYWFLNPVIALSIDGDLYFDDVRPGTMSYSETLLVGNDADESSGVILDMFISGTDFYDSSSSGAMCGTSNVLRLENFGYYATSGAYSTRNHDTRADDKGYVEIGYGVGFNDPNPFYDEYEILQGPAGPGGYYRGNTLTPGSEMALTFRLSLPEPCNGDFDTGSIYFWGEAI
jgi:hypothetical protein